MISVVYTRPAAWEKLDSTLDLTHVPIGGSEPRRNSGRLAGDGIGVVALPDMVDLLERTLREKKPDIYLRAVHQRFGRAEMERCRKASPDTLWCLQEGNQPWRVSNFVERFQDLVDVVMTNNWSDDAINAYLDFGVAVVPGFWDGFDPADHVPQPIGDATHDCFFGGSNLTAGPTEWTYPNGEQRCRFVGMVDEEFDLVLYGDKKGWHGRAKGVLHHVPYMRAMQTAKVLIGYNHLDLERYYTRRVIHSGASGRLFVTRYIPGMEKDFDQHQYGPGPVWFRDNEEGIELVRYYLENPDVREDWARSQRKLFLRDHTWEARLRRFEEIAPKLLERKIECVT